MHTDTIDNLQMIEESAKTFAQQQILPHVMEWDEAQYFPVETIRALGQLGLWVSWYLKRIWWIRTRISGICECNRRNRESVWICRTKPCSA